MTRVDTVGLEVAMASLLRSAGCDTELEGMKKTPHRYAKFLSDWIGAPEPEFTTFATEGMDEMVVVTGIPFYSLCEHHTLPFFGTAAVGYLPNERIAGLSKLPRAVAYCAAGFQNQERITMSVANMLQERLKPKGVAVVIRARHLCMEMRGARACGAETTTSRLTGAFRKDARARAEFMALARVEGR